MFKLHHIDMSAIFFNSRPQWNINRVYSRLQLFKVKGVDIYGNYKIN